MNPWNEQMRARERATGLEADYVGMKLAEEKPRIECGLCGAWVHQAKVGAFICTCGAVRTVKGTWVRTRDSQAGEHHEGKAVYDERPSHAEATLRAVFMFGDEVKLRTVLVPRISPRNGRYWAKWWGTFDESEFCGCFLQDGNEVHFYRLVVGWEEVKAIDVKKAIEEAW